MYPWDFIEGYTRILSTINRPHLDVEEVAMEVLLFMMDLFGAERGEIVLFRDNIDPKAPITEETAVRCRRHLGFSGQQYRELRESGVLLESVKRALTERKSFVVQDTEEEAPENAKLSRELGNGSWMNHVLEVEGQVVAFIHLAHRDKRRFDEDDLSNLRGVSLLLAVALNISRLWEQERKHMRDLIKTLNRVVEVKDQYTAGHIERVKLYSGRIAMLLNCPDDERYVIETAAWLHDLGKIGVPDEILNKPGPLTEDERRIMMEHVPIGDRILDNVPALEEARRLASMHHEYVDGSGYGGMADLPLGARVISVADAWDALTTTRPYRAAMPVEEAIHVMTDLDKKQWDSGVVREFVTAMHTPSFLAFAVRHGLIALTEQPTLVESYDADKSVLKFRDVAAFFASVDRAELQSVRAEAAAGGRVDQRFHLRRS